MEEWFKSRGLERWCCQTEDLRIRPHEGFDIKYGCRLSIKQMYPYLLSYLMLLELHYGGHMQRSWVAQERAGETGISIRESERQVDIELFLDEYPQWGLGTPHWSVVLHEMFLHVAKWGQKEAECMSCWGCWGSVCEPDPGVNQSAMELVGYRTFWKEMRDIYHSVYLLRRSLGFPSCGEWQRRRTIQDILSSLTDRLHRQAYPTTTGDPDLQEGGWVRPGWQESYEVALWVACQRVLDTAEALQSDLERLSREERERSQTRSHSRSRSQSRTHSRSWSRSHVRANSQSHSQSNLQNVCPRSPDKPLPRRRVTFSNPEVGKSPEGEEANCSKEPSISDVETWLEWQAWQLSTPTCWVELGAIPGTKDLHKFAQK